MTDKQSEIDRLIDSLRTSVACDEGDEHIERVIKNLKKAIRSHTAEMAEKKFREGWEKACKWYVEIDKRDFFKEEQQILEALLGENK